MTFEQVYNKVKRIEGWMGKNDCHVLYEYACVLENAIIVEIGPFYGKSTVVLALASPTSKIIAIDPYFPFLPPDDKLDPLYVYRKFKKYSKGLNIRLIKKTSEKALRNWSGKIDLLHIDGDHRPYYVKKDLKWIKHVKKGGFILLHDYTAKTPFIDVASAVPEKYGVFVDGGFGVIGK